MVLLSRVVVLPWHKVGSGRWSSQWQGCSSVCRGSEACGEDHVQVCALVHTKCTRQDRFSEAPTVRPTGFVVDVGTRTSEGTGGSKHKILKLGKCVGSGRVCGKQRAMQFYHSISMLGHSKCLLLSCLWAQPLCQSGQEWTWMHAALAGFNVGLLVEAGDRGGGAPVPSGYSRTIYFWVTRFFVPPPECVGDVG